LEGWESRGNLYILWKAAACSTIGAIDAIGAAATASRSFSHFATGFRGAME
jgi:hypothetical protein